MTENTPEKVKEDEIDLIVFFRLVGNFFSKIYDFFKSIFKSILSVLVFLLKTLIDNIKLIAISLVIAACIGYFLEKVRTPIYYSSMFVKPYFDSKYQLVNNINYFNALIENEDFDGLAEIFTIETDDAKMINKFEIAIGPESENEKIKQYDTYLKSLDSIRAQDISYDDFIENRNIYSSDFFEISVEARKKNIFKNLEGGLNDSFKNTYSEKKMKKRDSLIYIQKQSVISSIKSVDSLQQVYIKVLEEESKSTNATISLRDGLSVEPEKSRTKEFELLNKELALRNELRLLDEKKIEEDVFFDTVSGFQEVGSIKDSFFQRYSVVFPALTFIVFCLIFLASRTLIFVRNYEH
ncbi:hypothetical protein AB9K26_11645 [Psychroserpens sp. XS_ASV72]|uniref:hypothetical protein n=1 Tax=Psychroserpens sp. XS_ASV72 TaxID=3241293 RepID=UPI0035124146